MDSKMDLPHNRPMVPPKPDKDKISLPTSPPTPNTAESGCVSDVGSSLSKSPFFDDTSPNSASTSARKVSINGQNTSENESPRRPSAPPKPNSNHTPPPTNKPALPPKPSNNSCPRLSFTSSPPTSLTPPTTTSAPSSCKISPPLLPKGRNSISIANAILANKNSAGNKCEPSNFDDVTPRRHPIRSPSAPLSPRPNTVNFPPAPRPYSSIFNFPHPPEQQNLNKWNANSSPLSPSTRAKTVSLGRNVAPPTSPTGNSVTQFFTNKAATLARILPLDLNFGSKSSPPTNNINKSTTKSSISSHLNMTHNNSSNNNMSSSQFGRFHNNVSFSSNGPIPPPPPPRLRRKLSPVSSLSPVEDSPNSPNTPSVFSPQTTPPPSLIAPLAVAEEPNVIYAEVDKEKKWAARRLKSNGDLFPNNKDVATISVEKVESGQLKEEDVEEEGIQGSLVITINRDIDPKVVSVKSVIANSPSELIPEVPEKSKEGEETVASQIQFFEQSSSQAGSGNGNKELVKRESEVACVTSSVPPPKRQISAEDAVVDSWLGKYLKDPIFVDKSSSQKVKPFSVGHDSSLNPESTSSCLPNSDNLLPLNSSTETTCINLNKNENDNLPEVEDSSLSGNKSFLFSRLSTVGGGGGDEAVRSNSPLNNSREKTNENISTSSPMTMSNPKTKSIKKSLPKDHEGVTTTTTAATAKAETACPTNNDQDSLIQSVDSKIQSVVHRLSNLSGKMSPSSNQSESPPPPIPKISEEREFESLNITESGESCEQICNKLLLSPLRKETFHSDIAISSTNNDVTTDPTTSSESKEGSSSIVRRRSWNCSGDSSSPCESSSSSLTNLRDKHNRKVSGLGWVDEGDSTGVLGDVDTSDAPVPNSSSTEEIGSTFSLRRKKWGIFSSFGKPSSSSTSSSSNNGSPTKGSSKSRGKDKSRSLMSDMNGKIVNISRQISGPILISPPRQESPQDSKLLPREKSQSHSAVQFSPDVVDITSHQNNRHRFSEGSIGDEATLLPRPESEPGDDSSICSFSSVSTTGTGYTITMSPGYDSILAELSPTEKKAFYVAREILTSEQTFIDVLDLLTVDFPNAIRRYEDTLKHPVIPPQDLDVILGGLPNLKRVNEELQVDLQQRISNWIDHAKLADVIVKKGPFLKLYAHYIKNFEKITLKLDECCQQNVQFARAVQEFELSERCHKLGLKHYMLKPVQRMPQYRLLLEDYLKQLEPEGCDYDDTVKALAIVKDVADHANEAIKLQVNADKLLHLQNRMTGATLMKADRLLIKEGELVKVCRKDLQPRFFALMNDCLMCMSYNATAGSTKDLKMRNEMPLAGMKVCLSASEDYQNEFSVISTARSFNLVAKTAREREEWMKALNEAIHDNIRKRSCRTPDQEEGFALGKIAPVWIQDSRVTMCQICTAEFTVTFRRHHCRSCGKVVCRHCSGNQAPLQYLKNDAERVCDECYQYLLEEFDKDAGSNEGLETSRETIRTRFKKVTPNVSKRAQTKRNVKSRLEVPANNSGSRISSYLHWRERKAWKRRWFVLMDRVLYIYAASEDIVAIKGIPVLGWNVDVEKSEFMDGGDNEAVFKLSHLGQNTLLFQADNPTLAERWVNLMKEATVLT